LGSMEGGERLGAVSEVELGRNGSGGVGALEGEGGGVGGGEGGQGEVSGESVW